MAALSGAQPAQRSAGPKRAAWQRARSSPRLPEPSLRLYDELLDLSVGSLRQRYGVPEAGIAGSRTLHDNAPQATRA